MNKFLSTILTAAAIMPVFAAHFEPTLQIVPRYNAGTLEADVDRSQGRKGLNVQLTGASPEQTAMLNASHNHKVNRNMGELRKYVVCVTTPDRCKMASPK